MTIIPKYFFYLSSYIRVRTSLSTLTWEYQDFGTLFVEGDSVFSGFLNNFSFSFQVLPYYTLRYLSFIKWNPRSMISFSDKLHRYVWTLYFRLSNNCDIFSRNGSHLWSYFWLILGMGIIWSFFPHGDARNWWEFLPLSYASVSTFSELFWLIF